jgi:hypothetical protein
VTPDQIRAWFENNAGTAAATDAATNAVLTIVSLHSEVEQNFGDDAQPVCVEDGQDYDGKQAGCATVRAVALAIREQDPLAPASQEGGNQ